VNTPASSIYPEKGVNFWNMVIPEAFLLLTIPNVTLKAENVVLTGTIALQCVTIQAM
jgi:hypothetical protein